MHLQALLPAALLFILSSSSPAFAKKHKISPPHVVSDIRQSALLSTLRSLADIAASNGGNRAFGLPGYRASADFILAQLSHHKHSVNVKEQEFESTFSFVDEIQLNVLGEDPIFILGLIYSPSTPAEGVTRELVLGPEGEAGCSKEGYDGLGYPVMDKIVLVQRFKCPDNSTYGGRIRPAAAAGAKAVIIYHDEAPKPTGGTLYSPDPVGYRPSGIIHLADGLKWKKRLEGGEKLEVFFKQLQTIENRKTWNIIAETKSGDPNNVIVVGAHLDSVQAGPGINDNGSGIALILEILHSVHKYDTNLKLRFIWWGAEEDGVFGSKFYVNNLPQHELEKIRAYFNFDMVSRGYYGVFDGDGSTYGAPGAPGSDVIENLFVEYLESQGIQVTPEEFNSGSDYAAFMSRGIPVGGLHTGYRFEQDPCYHLACDVYENVNATLLTTNAKAAGHVIARLALDGKKLIPKWSTAPFYPSYANQIVLTIEDDHRGRPSSYLMWP